MRVLTTQMGLVSVDAVAPEWRNNIAVISTGTVKKNHITSVRRELSLLHVRRILLCTFVPAQVQVENLYLPAAAADPKWTNGVSGVSLVFKNALLFAYAVKYNALQTKEGQTSLLQIFSLDINYYNYLYV